MFIFLMPNETCDSLRRQTCLFFRESHHPRNIDDLAYQYIGILGELLNSRTWSCVAGKDDGKVLKSKR